MFLIIEVTKANPNIETLKLTLSVSFVVIGILLTIVGFFMAQQFKVIKTLQDTVNELAEVVAVIKNKQTWDGESCIFKHKAIDKKLEDHDKRLDKNENRITRLETLQNGKRM